MMLWPAGSLTHTPVFDIRACMSICPHVRINALRLGAHVAVLVVRPCEPSPLWQRTLRCANLASKSPRSGRPLADKSLASRSRGLNKQLLAGSAEKNVAHTNSTAKRYFFRGGFTRDKCACDGGGGRGGGYARCARAYVCVRVHAQGASGINYALGAALLQHLTGGVPNENKSSLSACEVTRTL